MHISMQDLREPKVLQNLKRLEKILLVFSVIATRRPIFRNNSVTTISSSCAQHAHELWGEFFLEW